MCWILEANSAAVVQFTAALCCREAVCASSAEQCREREPFPLPAVDRWKNRAHWRPTWAEPIHLFQHSAGSPSQRFACQPMAANCFGLAAASELPQPGSPQAPGCIDLQTAPQRGRDRDSNPHERTERQQNSVRLRPVLVLPHSLRSSQTLQQSSFAPAWHTSACGGI